MDGKGKKASEAAALRQRAEKAAREKAAESLQDIESLAPGEIRRMVHELEVHQIELEMQNEELQRAQADLDASRARYFDLYDLAPVGYVTVSEKGLILEANLTAATLLAVARSDLDKQPLSRFILAEDQDIYYRHCRRLFETGAPQTCELRMVKRAGAPFWVRLDATVAPDKAAVWLCVMIDISARKNAEAALRQSEEDYHQLFEAESDAIFLIDNQTGSLLQANRAACEMYGYRREELLTMKNADLSADPEQTRQVTRETPPDADRVITIPLRWHRHKDGTRFPVEITTGRFFLREGRPVHIAAIRNIAARVQAEAEQGKLQEKLAQARKMEAVGRLAGGVAHDFNNMLGVILGYSELALDKVAQDDPLHADLAEIITAARRSADITRQLLAFARKQTVVPKVLDLNETVEGMLTMLRRLIGEDIHISWQPSAGLWPVKIDPSQIDQILANLCVNARDAIGGVGNLSVETQNVSIDREDCADRPGLVPGEYVLVVVNDNGRGMDQATLANLFEPFFTTKGVGEGTGLGLATVYGIVKQNDGFINVDSEPDQGTTFKIYLPRHVGEVARADTRDAGGIPRGRGETVLVVEDEATILRLAQTMLQGLGYRVLAEVSARKAIAMAETQACKIDLLLTDVVMPEMNGRDLADRLKAVCPDLKVLFMSGYTAEVIAHRGIIDQGMQFIQKPFSRQELAARVREVMG